MASPDAAVEQTTSAALEEKAKLQRHFGRFDMFFFLICTLVGLDTIGAVASNGAQGFTWLMFLGLVFFIPYAFLTAELGAELETAGNGGELRLIASTAAGGPAHDIAGAAREIGAELIVVGTRGMGPIAGLLLGGVTQRLLHIAPCPVLSVPQPQS
ncbi:MAG TPA: universal stress protein [Gaiellales bacterium]|jgi:hypothetical protein